MAKIDVNEEDIQIIKDGLEMLMKSVRRSIAATDGDIKSAYEKRLARVSQTESRFFMTVREKGGA